jgi:hemolysin activation/secretion protein
MTKNRFSKFFKNYNTKRVLASFYLILLSPAIVLGQSAPAVEPNPAAALKNIQDNATLPPLNDQNKGLPEPQKIDARIYINKLTGIEVNNDLIKEQIIKYWVPYIGKSVSIQDVTNFKEWAWQKFGQAGYFAFLHTEVINEGEGQRLVIKISLPTVKEIKIYSKDRSLAEKYSGQIIGRIGDSGRPGHTVDTLSLEQKLDDISFDLPISVDLNIRPVDSEQVILVINVVEKASNPGSLRYGAVQVNNYGLSQYGSIQGLGIVAINGFTPDSSATVIAQGAEGLVYGRMEYEAPTETLAGRARVFAESVYSKTIYGGNTATQGLTSNYGAGLTNLLGSQRDMVFKSFIDLSQRNTSSKLQYGGAQISSIVDDQARLKFAADNDKLARDNIQHYEMTIVDGTDNNNGRYTFALIGATFQKSLNSTGLGLYAKMKAQGLPSRNLDTYNRLSLGGVNGLRAYTTLDGIGDMGAMGSIEIRQQYLVDHFVGAFYDGGVVKQNRNPVPGQYNTPYALQDVGLSFGGYVKGLNYSASVAKAIGSYAAFVPGVYETNPNSWRFNFALTYPI